MRNKSIYRLQAVLLHLSKCTVPIYKPAHKCNPQNPIDAIPVSQNKRHQCQQKSSHRAPKKRGPNRKRRGNMRDSDNKVSNSPAKNKSDGARPKNTARLSLLWEAVTLPSTHATAVKKDGGGNQNKRRLEGAETPSPGLDY